MGRRTFETGDPDSYVGNYEFQVPIFVLTHQPQKIQSLKYASPPIRMASRQRMADLCRCHLTL